MDGTVTITIEAYTELVKDAFRYEMLKEHLSKCEYSYQAEIILERFGIAVGKEKKEDE